MNSGLASVLPAVRQLADNNSSESIVIDAEKATLLYVHWYAKIWQTITMTPSIDFYFDFSSPYGYLASKKIEALAEKHNRLVNWHPILLGAIFKITKQAPLTTYPLKGDYALMDFARTARETGLPYRHPTEFPIGAVAASRASYWLTEHEDPSIATRAVPFIHAIFAAYYCDDRNISLPAVVLEVAASVGIDPNTLEISLSKQEIKDRLRSAVEAALERKVFGSPTLFVDDQQFWGNDRMEQLDRWLTRGGW
ncbi:MAG: 2-hydroxychromene-2-carboxylate isomerase [Granulosicoccus sp.]